MPDLCRELGISSGLFYRWPAKFGEMDMSMMARMKELEEENRRLRQMVVDERLKGEIVQEALEKSGEAISSVRDGQTSGSRETRFHQGGVSGLPSE